MAMTRTDRFMAKVQPQADGCWLWTGSMHPWGYGQFRMEERPVMAHRASYRLFVGPIPVGLYIDHLCFNKRCVNPSHLEPVSNAENIARGYHRHWPEHCPRGHAWTEANTYRKAGTFRRECRRCHADRQSAYKAQRQMAVTEPLPGGYEDA